MNDSTEDRIVRLQTGGVMDMHFDLPMNLYEKSEPPRRFAGEIFARIRSYGA